MGYHAVNEGGVMNVYWMSSCEAGSEIGKLYNGEVFTCLGITTGYQNVNEVRFRDSKGVYTRGFIDRTTGLGPLYLYGKKVTEAALGTCYRFKLRSALKIVYNNGSTRTILQPGGSIYTKSATCGQSEPRNIKIVGYGSASAVTPFDGFATLDYEASGSMINSNFCIYKP